MKKILSFILCLVLCFTLLCACNTDASTNSDNADDNTNNTEDSSNVFSASPYEVTDKIREDFDFTEAEFYTDADEYALDALMYQYGLEDQAILDAVDKYTFTVPGTNSAKTFAVITFKEGTSADVIKNAEKAIKDIYIANLINTTAVYDATQSEIADKASFVAYDNALVVIAYDANGNTDIIDAVNELNK